MLNGRECRILFIKTFVHFKCVIETLRRLLLLIHASHKKRRYLLLADVIELLVFVSAYLCKNNLIYVPYFGLSGTRYIRQKKIYNLLYSYGKHKPGLILKGFSVLRSRRFKISTSYFPQ